MSTQKDQTSVDLSNFERDIKNCDWMINHLTSAIESGNTFSWNDRREFQNAWDARWRAVANGNIHRQLLAEERLDRLANSGRSVEDHQALLLGWIEQRRRLIDTMIRIEVAANDEWMDGFDFDFLAMWE